MKGIDIPQDSQYNREAVIVALKDEPKGERNEQNIDKTRMEKKKEN